MKVLMVYAHCDDELLWGWPWLLNSSFEKSVLICSSDMLNPKRQEYSRGPEALKRICDRCGVEDFHVQTEFFSEFYKLRTRGAGDGPLLKDWWTQTSENIAQMSKGFDLVVTHNPHGEYQHIDHLMVNRCVLSTTNLPVQWTGAFVQTGTWPVGVGWLGEYQYSKRCIRSEFESFKAEYESRQCWTWSSDEPMTVSVYQCEEHAKNRALLKEAAH